MAKNRADHRQLLLAHLRSVVATASSDGLSRLPAERVLAADLGVSRGALRSLLACLADEGLLQPRAQSGWHINSATISEPSQTLVGFTEMSRLHGHEPRARVLSSVVRLCRDSEATRLRIPNPSKVWMLRRLRYLGEQPTSLEEVVMPCSRAADLTQIDMSDESLFAALSQRGIEVSRTDVVVDAEVADATLANILDLCG